MKLQSALAKMGILLILIVFNLSCLKKAYLDNPFYGFMGLYYSIFQTSDKEIEYYSFEQAHNEGLVRNISSDILGKRIRMYVPYQTKLESMIATYEKKSKYVHVGNNLQTSTKSINDFRNDLVYHVTANDDTIVDYTVIIDEGTIDSKRMKTFGFLQKQNNISRDSYGVFIGYTINVILPFGATLNPLITKFTSDGANITIGGVTQNSESTSNDFEKPITYRVHAADGTYQDYPVSVAIASKDSKEIIYFVFTQDANFGNLNGDYFATIVGNSISVTLPYNTNLKNLVASFVSSGRTISVNNATQRSNITANDFSKTVIYTVTAADDTSVEYAVTVRLQEFVPLYCIWDTSSFDSGCLWE